MKITVFTSNQPRHISLIKDLAAIADEVYAIQECNTVFPGKVDDFFKKSEVMQDYFANVIRAERDVFGGLTFLPSNVKSMALKMHDLTKLDIESLKPALESDVYVVFGATYIRKPLINILVENKAINIHMGVSPYYRGSSCNFWALQQGNYDLVGSTIHMLSKGLDSGAMLFHALPKPVGDEPFVFGMKAVRAAHKSLVKTIASGELFDMQPVVQDREMEISYTRNSDFDDDVAKAYLENSPTADDLTEYFKTAPQRDFLNPQFY